MTGDAYRHVAVAIRLAMVDGVSVPKLARECGIDRKTAHRILSKLTSEGLLSRDGGRGRRGYTYRWTSGRPPGRSC